MEKELAERIALFRFGVIAPLVDRHLSRGERERILGEITHTVWQIPGSARSAVARSTVLKWVAAYRNSGGDIRSLEPRPRIDRGSSRSIDQDSFVACPYSTSSRCNGGDAPPAGQNGPASRPESRRVTSTGFETTLSLRGGTNGKGCNVRGDRNECFSQSSRRVDSRFRGDH